MSDEFPDDWFRAHPGSDGDDRTRVRARVDDGDERWTDQFKPGYIPAPEGSAARRTQARATTEAPSTVEPRTSTTGASHQVGVEHFEPRSQPPAPAPRPPRRHVLPVFVTCVTLGVAALLAHRMLSDQAPSSEPSAPTGSSTPAGGSGAAAQPWSGAVKVVRPTGVTTTCKTAGPIDEFDQTVPSGVERLVDGDIKTGWRCDGSARGQSLTFTFPAGTQVVGVRVVNGYARTVDETDIYPLYRRATEARWSFPGLGEAYFVQPLADGVQLPQEAKIPPTAADGGMKLVLQTTSEPGTSDTAHDALVMSEVTFLAPA